MMSNPKRWKQRLHNLIKAHAKLATACQKEAYSELEQAGLIQTFEFSFELSWKTLKDLLNFEGFDVASPRSVIRTALEARHLSPQQCETFLEALEKRNLLTHSYDEEMAQQAQTLIKNSFEPAIAELVAKLQLKSKH